MNTKHKNVKIFQYVSNIPTCVITCTVVDGVEVLVQYKLFGLGKTIDWAGKSVKKVIGTVEKKLRSK